MPQWTNGALTKGQIHHVSNVTANYVITTGFGLAWFVILISYGAHFGNRKRKSRKTWRSPTFGTSIPFIQNAMTIDAFEFMWRYIHFSNSARKKKEGNPGFNLLFKVGYALYTFLLGIQSFWMLGKHVTINKSMSKYMGFAVAYVQYMSAKPIKYGIKVFTLSCAYSSILLNFEVYLGKYDEVEGDAMNVCDCLCKGVHITGRRGHVLYTNNYYTSIKLAKCFLRSTIGLLLDNYSNRQKVWG